MQGLFRPFTVQVTVLADRVENVRRLDNDNCAKPTRPPARRAKTLQFQAPNGSQLAPTKCAKGQKQEKGRSECFPIVIVVTSLNQNLSYFFIPFLSPKIKNIFFKLLKISLKYDWSVPNSK